MKRSTQRILTSHAGSLPRPPDLLALNRAKQRGEAVDDTARRERGYAAIPDIVRRQVAVGLDIVNDGELSKVNFLAYAQERLSGFEPDTHADTARFERRDFQRFEAFYRELYPSGRGPGLQVACTGPIRYTGQALLRADLDALAAAATAAGLQREDVFVTSIAASSYARGQNRYYPSEEEFLSALSGALKEEYTAIVDAGFTLQLDDPGLPAGWDAASPATSIEDYRASARLRIEALNQAIGHLPTDRIRYHICWGSWHGPHTTDIPLRDVVDVLLLVHAGTYSVEAANVRHELDWRVWREVKLPEGKLLMPGVVSHATNLVEPAELVADRIVRYAELVGRENVIAGTDCGLGGRVHPQVAWAKLEALTQGAALASRTLWP